MNASAASTPRRRGRPRKNAQPVDSQFPGTVIRFDSRPRLMVGDVVELCRCQPSNRGKLAIVDAFLDDGRVRIRAMSLSFDAVDKDTGEPLGTRMTVSMRPESLYRRSNRLLERGAA